MPEAGVPLSPEDDNLTTPEILLLSELFVSQGVNKIRLTGGEPTIRKDIVYLMQCLGNLRSKGLKELALTTNGVALWRKLDAMAEAGLTGVNLSLDTLDPHLFQIITRRKGFEAVIKSMDRIQELNKLGAGIKLKINCVVTRGVNDREILDFVELGREKDIEVRFIEYMPFDGNKWEKKKMFSYEEMLQVIQSKHHALHRLHDKKGETSKTWQVPGFVGKIGFITSMTENFCGTCNRLRITSDGNLKVCLFGNSEVSLRDLLREGTSGRPMDEHAYAAIRKIESSVGSSPDDIVTILKDPVHEQQLLDVIGKAVDRKRARHAGMENLSTMPNRPMILIDDLRQSFAQALKSVFITSGSKTSRYIANGTASQSWRRTSHSGSPRVQQRCISSSTHRHGMGEQQTETMETTTMTKTRTRAAGYNEKEVADLGAVAFTASEFGIAREDCLNPKSWQQKLAIEGRSDSTGATRQETETVEQLAMERMFPFMRHLLEWNVLDEEEFEQQSTLLEAALSAIDRKESFDLQGLRLDLMAELKKMIEDVVVWKHPNDGLSHKIARMAALEKLQKATGKTLNELEQADVKPPLVSNLSKVELLPTPGSSETTDRDWQAISNKAIDKSTGNRRADLRPDGRNLPNVSTNAGSEITALAAAQMPSQLPHLTAESNVHMVSIGEKSTTFREALAIATVTFSSPSLLPAIRSHSLKKGDVLSVARIAAIMGAKRTSDIVPLCHPGLQITNIEVDVEAVNAHSSEESLTNPELSSEMSTGTMDAKIFIAKKRWMQRGTGHHGGVKIVAKVACAGKTGVEMEALTAASAGALTVVDMCKALDKNMSIGGLKMVYKAGGRSGTFVDDDWLHS